MRLIRSGKTELRIRATNLARIYFSQEFGCELDRYVIDEIRPEREIQRLAEALLKIVWVMWKADAYYNKSPMMDYASWLKWIIERKFDISDCISGIMAEIEHGFTVTRTYGAENSGADAGNLAQKVAAVALRMGMSLDDLNELTSQAMIDLMHEYVGKDENGEQPKRQATLREIGMMYGR